MKTISPRIWLVDFKILSFDILLIPKFMITQWTNQNLKEVIFNQSSSRFTYVDNPSIVKPKSSRLLACHSFPCQASVNACPNLLHSFFLIILLSLVWWNYILLTNYSISKFESVTNSEIYQVNYKLVKNETVYFS